MSAIIEDVTARKILNSRGNLTIEVDITTINGFGTASAPSGASTGKAEAVPFPDGGVEGAVRSRTSEGTLPTPFHWQQQTRRQARMICRCSNI